MHAYVINLARSPDRRAEITTNLDRYAIDYEIVNAIDAQDFELTDPHAAGKVSATFYDKFRPGEAGCALSHMSVYRKILADGLHWALVLEDDIIAPPELSAIADAVAGYMEGAEVALLNFDSEGVVQVRKVGAIDLPATRQLVVPVHARQPESAAAYVITREACARMTERAFPIQTKADDWAHFIRIGTIDRLRCVVPLVVRKHPRFGSTMGYYSDSSLKARALAVIDRLGLGLVQRMVASRRERIWRRYTRVEFVDDLGSVLPSSRRG
jgi:glycosyl transferase, family 25